MGNNESSYLIMRTFEENVDEFLDKLSNSIETDEIKLSLETKLEDIDWDSLAAISSIALIDEIFGIVISVERLSRCETIEDIISLTKK